MSVLLLILLIGLSSQPALAQEPLFVESTSVENGDTNVPLEGDFRITFSTAISTVGVPDIGLDGLPIDIDLTDEDCPPTPAIVLFAPEGCATSWSLEDGGRTLVLEGVTISADETTTLVVLFAISTEGAVLEQPFAVRFTASDTIDQGSVSGTVSSADVEVGGSLVAVVPGNLVDLAISGDTAAIDPVLAFADENGDYEAAFVPDQEYTVIGLQFDLAQIGQVLGAASKVNLEGFAIGSHDGDGDGIVDLVTVVDGGSVEGVDVNLVKTGMNLVETSSLIEAQIAAGGVTGARLSLAAGAPLEQDGTSTSWVLAYTHLLSGRGWLGLSMGDLVFPPDDVSDNADLMEIFALFAGSMFTDYADSDQAVEWFRNNGGAEFLDANPGAIGFGLLLDRQLFDLLLLLLQGGGGIPFAPGLDAWGEVLAFEPVAGAIRGVLSKQQALEAWIVGYLGTESDLGLHLVAMADDGSALLIIGSSKAADNKNNADGVAAAWENDATLISVGTIDLPVSSDGSALAWAYNYYSPSRDSVLNVVVSGGAVGTVLTQSVIPSDGHPSTEGLSDDWIDSDEAIAAADQIAGGFIANHVGVTTTAVLSKGFHIDSPDLAIWRVTYTGGTAEGTTETRIVDIDAATGVYVSVETDRVLPGSFALGQNYPNPFNPETVIPFEVREGGTIKLTLYNALGQQIRVLVNGVRSEGVYEVRWDATDGSGNAVPSGLYLYRLESRESIETRRMVLLR